MIYIGNQTSAWSATPTEPFEYALANAFDAFEWFPDKKTEAGWDENDLDKTQRRNIRDAARERGMRLSVHAPWQANLLHAEARAILTTDLELAKDLGAALLNIHLYAENGIIGFLEAIGPLIRETADAGLQLSIENTPHHAPEDFNELFARLREIHSCPTEHVGMCLDLGHANLCTATRNDYLRFVDRLAAEVVINHLHLHENWGDADTHLPLFTGPAGHDDSGIRGFMRRMRQRGFSGSIIFEQWPHPPTLLNNARDKLIELLKLPHGRGVRPSAGAATSEGKKALELAGPEDRRTPQGPGSPTSNSDFAEALVATDKQARSWREKLNAVRELLVQQKGPIKREQLVDLAIYLRFLSTGQIACVEDGRHFRPGHHAGIALDIQKRLGQDSLPETRLLLRKIVPFLPSSSEVFRRAEPLTRIRDIAHRNDIPSELKHEIKQSLQNKLHRCAGPEDLVTSAKLLEQITAPGTNYPPAFVEQFRIFHEELKEFFNASSLEERLRSLLAKAEPEPSKCIQQFLKLKAEPAPERLNMFEVLTALRRSLAKTIANNPGPETQEFFLADIALEDFAFVLLSEMLNELESSEGGMVARPANKGSSSNTETWSGTEDWRSWLQLCSQIISHLELSQVMPEESHALAGELDAWRKDFDPTAREDLLRVKASLERGRRLAEDFSEGILALFPERVLRLGHALGIADYALRIYGEAEVRGHLVFQFSKLISLLLRRIREQLALPPWDVLVTGRATGRLRTFENLIGASSRTSEPVIALAKEAEGDEEIPKGVVGIILAHEVPHLSHLGVRARQAGVVFVASEERSDFETLSQFDEQVIELKATPDRVEWKHVDNTLQPQRYDERGEETNQNLCGPRVSAVEGLAHAREVLEVRLSPGRPCIPILDATLDIAGAKADGVRQLLDLSRQPGADFSVPAALVIPFGVMEAALTSDSARWKKYQDLVSGIDSTSSESLPAIAESIRKLIAEISVPSEIPSTVGKEFSREARLMARSSANCEDLEQMSGAGLYDSVANVVPKDVSASVLAVWASLWTRRAALSRKTAGIPQNRAHMAVLIQQMIDPEYSFVLHTLNPINQNPCEIYAEIAVGLGETLVSAASRGTPYRLVCDKESGSVNIVAFANFSRALHGGPNGKALRTLDYSTIALSRDAEARKSLGHRLAKVGQFVENALKKPQDIEGAVVGDKLYLVQSRPQQGVRGT